MASVVDNSLVLSELEEGLRDVAATRYALAAGLVIMFYDWILNLKGEVKLIWPAKRSGVKAIFLANRYFVPFILVGAGYVESGRALWFKRPSCTAYFLTESFLVVTFYASMHYVVSLRIWALYGRSVGVGMVLWGSFVVYLIATFAITVKSVLAIPFELFPVVNVCFGSLPSFMWAIWLPSLLYETLVFLLTLIKAIEYRIHGVDTPLVSTLYRDGFLYYLFIVLSTLCNLIFLATASQTKVLLIKYVSTACAVAAGSHLILDLREVGRARLKIDPSFQSNGITLPRRVACFRPAISEAGIAQLLVGQSLRPISFMTGPPRRRTNPTPAISRAPRRSSVREPHSANSWTPPDDWAVFTIPDGDDNAVMEEEEDDIYEINLTDHQIQSAVPRSNESFPPLQPSSSNHIYPPASRPGVSALQLDIPPSRSPCALTDLDLHPYA